MAASTSFDDLVGQLRRGDEGAARAIFERYTQRLVALARQRLDRRLTPKIDAEDVVQSVYKSFFVRQAEGRYVLTGWDDLWGLLVRITLNKCISWDKYFHAERRQVGRERSPPESDSSSLDVWQAIAREPTPQEAAQLAELVEGLMRHLPDREREMLSLRLQGYSVREISEAVGRGERTVERLLNQARKWLARTQQEQAAVE